MYLNKNNLYGKAMSEKPLIVDRFELDEKTKLQRKSSKIAKALIVVTF